MSNERMFRNFERKTATSRSVIRQKIIVSAFFCTGVLAATSASGLSLEEALANAYFTNPGLQAARAKLRVTDETVNQAISGWRPNVELKTSAGYSRVENLNEFTGSRGLRQPRSAEISVKQNLYAGGRTVAETEQREFDVLWRRAELAVKPRLEWA